MLQNLTVLLLYHHLIIAFCGLEVAVIRADDRPETVAVAGCLTHLILWARSTQSGIMMARMLTTKVGRNARTPDICPNATLRK